MEYYYTAYYAVLHTSYYLKAVCETVNIIIKILKSSMLYCQMTSLHWMLNCEWCPVAYGIFGQIGHPGIPCIEYKICILYTVRTT